MIVNELLTYASFYLNNSSIDNIKKIMLNFYSHEEIVDSKKLLWSISGTDLGCYSDRKSSEKRTCDDANLSDIFEALLKLDSIQNLPEFVARDLSKIPERSPEELNLTFILDRINRLEKSVRITDDIVITHSTLLSKFEINDFDSKFTKLENKIQEHGVALADLTARSRIEYIDDNKSLQSLPIDNSVDEFKVINTDVESAGDDGDWTSLVGQSDFSNVTKKKSYNDATLQFLNRYDRKSCKKRKRIGNFKSENNFNKKCTATDNSGIYNHGDIELKGAPSRKESLFLGRVSQGSCDSVIKYIHSKGVDVHDISLVSNINFKSFRIIVSRDNCRRLLDKFFWHDGVIVKP